MKLDKLIPSCLLLSGKKQLPKKRGEYQPLVITVTPLETRASKLSTLSLIAQWCRQHPFQTISYLAQLPTNPTTGIHIFLALMQSTKTANSSKETANSPQDKLLSNDAPPSCRAIIALPTSLDCRLYTTRQIQALFEMPYEAHQQIKILNFSGNQNFTDAHFTEILSRLPNLQTLHIDGTNVSPEKQALLLKYHTVKDAIVALGLTVGKRFFLGCSRDTLPFFNLQSLDAAGLQDFIKELNNPANREHAATIEEITFAGNQALTDELFEGIISLLPNVGEIIANLTNITQLPASLSTREHLTRVWCTECRHITNRDRPAGLRPDIYVSMERLNNSDQTRHYCKDEIATLALLIRNDEFAGNKF